MISLARLPFASLLELLSASPALRALAEERTFPVYDGGCLRLSVPPLWQEEFHIAAQRCSMVFRTGSRSSALLRVETTALSVQESLVFSIEEMRREVEAAARAASAESIEVFSGRHGGGFHFTTIEPGTARRLIQGRFLARPVLLDFRIDASGRFGGVARAALELVRSARASAT
jgi:hypothetical protein